MFFNLCDLKFVKSNDKKVAERKHGCRIAAYPFKEIASKEPVWVFTYKSGKFKGGNRQYSRWRAEKVNNADALHYFLTKPRELYKIIKPHRKETTKSLLNKMREQFIEWFENGLTLQGILPEKTQSTLLHNLVKEIKHLKNKTIDFARGDDDPSLLTGLRELNPVTLQYDPVKKDTAFILKAINLSITEYIYIISKYKAHFAFEQYLTANEASIRYAATVLMNSSNLTEAQIRERLEKEELIQKEVEPVLTC